jgi:hypothetical protein
MIDQLIDKKIAASLTLLSNEQAENGYFRTYDIQPNYGSGMVWREYEKNGFVTANILVPLATIQSKIAMELLRQGYTATIGNKNKYGLWQYFNDKNEAYFIPYETDTSSLFSYVASKLNKPEDNKELFYEQINKDAHFNLWFLPNYISVFNHPFYKLDVWLNWNKAQKRLAFINKLVSKEDAEFCVSANVLLYLGANEHTQQVVENLVAVIKSNAPIPLLYYPHQLIACYLFSRAAYYTNIEEFLACREEIKTRVFTALNSLAEPDELLKLLAAVSLLIFNEESDSANKLYEECIDFDKMINQPFAFYCSNSMIDYNFETRLHNAYFGAPALTIAIYIEFLNLFRIKKTGRSFSELLEDKVDG